MSETQNEARFNFDIDNDAKKAADHLIDYLSWNDKTVSERMAFINLATKNMNPHDLNRIWDYIAKAGYNSRSHESILLFITLHASSTIVMALETLGKTMVVGAAANSDAIKNRVSPHLENAVKRAAEEAYKEMASKLSEGCIDSAVDAFTEWIEKSRADAKEIIEAYHKRLKEYQTQAELQQRRMQDDADRFRNGFKNSLAEIRRDEAGSFKMELESIKDRKWWMMIAIVTQLVTFGSIAFIVAHIK
jgi:hypothetical protein